MEKTCSKCKETKDATCFSRNNTKKQGLQSQCKACKKTTDAENYRKDKQNQLNRVKANKQKCRDMINDLKRQKGCCTCPETEPCCLDFHVEEKTGSISKLTQLGNFDQLRSEVERCIVLCSNCHRKVHAGLISLHGLQALR